VPAPSYVHWHRTITKIIIIKVFVLMITVDKWRLHRRIIAPVFNNKLMKHLFPVFHEKNEILIKKISIEVDKTQPFNLWDYIASTSLDTICRKYGNN
jgi:cytochrome P450 family 4